MPADLVDNLLRFAHQVDVSILRDLNAAFTNNVLQEFIVWVCGSKLLRGAVPLACYWFLWFGSKGDALQSQRTVLIKGLFASLAAIIVARSIAFSLPVRIRPFADPNLGIHLFSPPDGDFEDWSAFPSDTAAFEFALAWSLMRISPVCSVWLAAYGLVVACLPRIITGIHFPSDILVGMLIGMVTSALMQRLRLPTRLLSGVLQWEGGQPVFYAMAFMFTCELAQLFENVRLARKSFVHMWRTAGTLTELIPVLGAGALLAALIATGALLFWRSTPKSSGMGSATSADAASSGWPLSRASRASLRSGLLHSRESPPSR